MTVDLTAAQRLVEDTIDHIDDRAQLNADVRLLLACVESAGELADDVWDATLEACERLRVRYPKEPS
jgi:hypothetical protein